MGFKNDCEPRMLGALVCGLSLPAEVEHEGAAKGFLGVRRGTPSRVLPREM